MPLKLRLAIAANLGFVLGLLMNRLPFWAAMVLLAGGAVWAFAQVISVQRDLNRLKAELENIEDHLREDQ